MNKSALNLLASISLGVMFTACQTSPAAQKINLLGVTSQVSTSSFKVLGTTVKANTSSIRNGQVVDVSGSVESDGSVNASSVTADTEIKAAIETISSTGLTVLGQTVVVDANTVFEDSNDTALTLSGLKVGDFVEIYGLRQSDGSLLATRIELEKGPKPVGNHLHGSLSALNATAKTFSVGNQAVDYSSATVTGTLADGVRVEVQGAVNSSKVLVATKVTVLAHGKKGEPGTSGQTHIEGIGSSLDATAKTITVQNYVVHFDAATVEGTPANGMRVEVTGTLNTDGSIAATKIEFEGEHHGGIGDANAIASGSIGALDATAKTITVNSIVYTTDANTVFENNDAHITFADLKVGDAVEIKFLTAGNLIRKLEIGGHGGGHH